MAIGPRKRFLIFQRDAFRCQYCGRGAIDGATLHIDHIVPQSKGGESTDDNLITACSKCNYGKSNTAVVDDDYRTLLDEGLEEAGVESIREYVEILKRSEQMYRRYWMKARGIGYGDG